MTMKTLTRSAAVLAMVIAAVADASGVPAVLTQQGRLLNSNGTPATGPVTLVFSIYDTTSSTVALWTETQSAPLGDGYFVVQLGRTTPLSSTLWTGATRFLGLKVGADPEMTPRQELVSVPYALAAADAIGDIHPTSVIVNGSTVINGAGAWVGAPTGLVGPQGAMGAPGATGVPGQSVVGASEAAGVNCCCVACQLSGNPACRCTGVVRATSFVGGCARSPRAVAARVDGSATGFRVSGEGRAFPFEPRGGRPRSTRRARA